MSHRPAFTVYLTTALSRPVGAPSTYSTRDEARAAVRYAFDQAMFCLVDAPHHAVISHPDGTRETIEFGRASIGDPEARRLRLLRFVTLYDDLDPRHRFRLRLGDAVIRFESLTDAALEDLSADMVEDFWRDKRIKRENRAAGARLTGEQRLRLVAAE